MRFSIRDLLWATVVVAMGLGWWAEQRANGETVNKSLVAVAPTRPDHPTGSLKGRFVLKPSRGETKGGRGEARTGAARTVPNVLIFLDTQGKKLAPAADPPDSPSVLSIGPRGFDPIVATAMVGQEVEFRNLTDKLEMVKIWSWANAVTEFGIPPGGKVVQEFMNGEDLPVEVRRSLVNDSEGMGRGARSYSDS